MSLFASRNDNPADLDYISEVDFALKTRGHPWAFTLSLATLLFFLVAFVWADFAMVSDITRGQGQITPSQGVHPIQSDRGGTIAEIRVKENQNVEVDEVLVTLANVDVASSLQESQNKRVELEATLVRLAAEAKGETPDFSGEQWDLASEPVQAQIRLFETRRSQFESEDRQLLLQIEQRRSDTAAAQQRRSQYEQELAFLLERERRYKILVGKTVTEMEYLSHRQEVVNKQGELESVAQTIARNASAVRVVEERLQNVRNERQAKIADEMNKTRIELNTVEQQIKAGSESVNRTELRSPVRGTVKRILLKQDSVAKAAETILEILPTEGALEVEAKFSPADRGFLFVNQEAVVKVTAYDFSIYGGLAATVIKISQDTVVDKRGDPWYEVRLLTKRNTLQYRGEELEILPGMTAQVDVVTNQQSVLNLLLAPLKRATQLAMTEH
ncbi:MAG: HlyD family secretion protein [Desulfovibrio sp.]|jgi:adhesin transport system membrane fusion protein|nr:HlyD family secretion protein [Desulfovibrio sp.]